MTNLPVTPRAALAPSALTLLEKAASEVHRKGAVGGAQWPKLAGALVRARAWTDTRNAGNAK